MASALTVNPAKIKFMCLEIILSVYRVCTRHDNTEQLPPNFSVKNKNGKVFTVVKRWGAYTAPSNGPCLPSTVNSILFVLVFELPLTCYKFLNTVSWTCFSNTFAQVCSKHKISRYTLFTCFQRWFIRLLLADGLVHICCLQGDPQSLLPFFRTVLAKHSTRALKKCAVMGAIPQFCSLNRN